MLQIPSNEEKRKLIKAFNKDQESYTVLDEVTNCLLPVICCVCDSMPKTPQWSTTVEVPVLRKLLDKAFLHRDLLEEKYPKALLDQYSCSEESLKPFVLSPATFVNHNDEVVICKECLSDLRLNAEKRLKLRHPPKQSIANGYVIGEAPVELTDLNDCELSLISRVRTHSQTWMFRGGCHQQIKGWHSFFKNRPGHNVANLANLTESGLKGSILVVLCGPFTTTQKAMCWDHVNVNPELVCRAWQWLINNNFRYKDEVVPNVNDIPIPQLISETM
jgi:hypothetical protein